MCPIGIKRVAAATWVFQPSEQEAERRAAQRRISKCTAASENDVGERRVRIDDPRFCAFLRPGRQHARQGRTQVAIFGAELSGFAAGMQEGAQLLDAREIGKRPSRVRFREHRQV